MINGAQILRDAQALVSAVILGEDVGKLWLDLATGGRRDPAEIGQWACGVTTVIAKGTAGMVLSAAGGDQEKALEFWRTLMLELGADSDSPDARRLRGETDDEC